MPAEPPQAESEDDGHREGVDELEQHEGGADRVVERLVHARLRCLVQAEHVEERVIDVPEDRRGEVVHLVDALLLLAVELHQGRVGVPLEEDHGVDQPELHDGVGEVEVAVFDSPFLEAPGGERADVVHQEHVEVHHEGRVRAGEDVEALLGLGGEDGLALVEVRGDLPRDLLHALAVVVGHVVGLHFEVVLEQEVLRIHQVVDQLHHLLAGGQQSGDFCDLDGCEQEDND